MSAWKKYDRAGRLRRHVAPEDRDAMAESVEVSGAPGCAREGSASRREHGVDCGELAGVRSAAFAARYVPKRVAGTCVRAAEFLPGRSASEAIEAALAAAGASGAPVTVVLDAQDWIIDRAVLLPSNTELVIDGCTLKLADRVFDNIIRAAGIMPNPADPYGVCSVVHPIENIRITGRGDAVLEDATEPYIAANPKTGVEEPWLGDFFGWRTVGIQLSKVRGYEISGFTMRKTHCWAISQEQCACGYLHDIVFDTAVKNGDGIDFRNGCSYCLVDNITGTTSDDTVACTALNRTCVPPESKYVYPMQPLGRTFTGAAADIHDIVIRNIRTGGQHHGVICLATSPSVYNIVIENVIEEAPSTRESCVRIYTGYGTGYEPGNLRNISVSNVISRGARYAVLVKAAVKDVRFTGIRQLNRAGTTHLFEGESANLGIEDCAAG